MNTPSNDDLAEIVELFKEALKLIDEDISNYKNPYTKNQFYNLTVDLKWRTRVEQIINKLDI